MWPSQVVRNALLPQAKQVRTPLFTLHVYKNNFNMLKQGTRIDPPCIPCLSRHEEQS